MSKSSIKPEGNNHNIIAFGTKIEGNITLDLDIRIEGEINGNIYGSGKVIIGKTGVINGDTSCQNIDILGKVTGNITASETISLKETAVVNGNLTTAVISIEPNAQFIGNCKTTTIRE